LKGGLQQIFWTKFRNVSFGPPFQISIEFWQKSLEIMIFVEKKNFLTKFWGLRQKLSIKSDEFTPGPLEI
jgi:hypothetical protein